MWVGEWHTHPQGPPRPSGRDLRTYRSFLGEEELRFTVFVALIVIPTPTSGSDGPSPDISCWVVDNTTSARTPLHVVLDQEGTRPVEPGVDEHPGRIRR